LNISECFRARGNEGRRVLVPYVTCGFPSAEATHDTLDALVEHGADVIELGVPFSDPLADGPTIQKTSFDALEAGMTLPRTLEVLASFRARHANPVVLFSYLNPILRYGVADFLQDAVDAGAHGLLLTDVPTGADPALESQILDSDLDLIRLLAPTTEPGRVPDVARSGQGFLYYISRTGVTGVRQELRGGLGEEVAALRKLVDLPVAVGFGISTPEQARMVADVADGVVVGSALLKVLTAEGPEGAGRYLGTLRAAMDER
jgi:tryptophan synthase alpha chain